MKMTISCLAIVLLGSTLVSGREPKEYDSDVIYDESKIPHYDLPPLLVSSEGNQITTAEEWFNIRRPQIMSFWGVISAVAWGACHDSIHLAAR